MTPPDSELPSEAAPTESVAPTAEHAYGTHPLQTLDVYHPVSDGRPCRPTTVLVHGGGFARGDKRRPHGTVLFDHLRDILLQAGNNVVSINYRLAADDILPAQHPFDDKWPAAHEDVVAALVWIRENQAKLGVTWPVAVIGESAGGNLAAALAYTPRLQVQALVSIGGYADLPTATAPAVVGIVENYIGCTLKECRKAWVAASPARHARRSVPLLVWHGANDFVVEWGQAFTLARANADAAGSSEAAPSTVQLLPGAGHTGLVGFAEPERDAELLAFLGRYNHPDCE